MVELGEVGLTSATDDTTEFGDEVSIKDVRNPSVQVRGVYIPCNQEHEGNKSDHDQGTNLTNKCSRKILISIKFVNIGPRKIKDEYLVLNHIYDPIVNSTSQLLNPIVFKVNQEQIVKVYDLKYLKNVNGEAKEVIKQQAVHSNACGHSGSYPFCGSHHLRDYKGHCCICPSGQTSNDNGNDIIRSTQHQTNSTPLPGILNTLPVGTSPENRKNYDGTPSLKIIDQMTSHEEDQSRFFAKGKDKHSHLMGDMKNFGVDNLQDTSFENYMRLDEDSSKIKYVPQSYENSQDIFIPKRSGKNNPRIKGNFNIYQSEQDLALGETNNYDYKKPREDRPSNKSFPSSYEIKFNIIRKENNYDSNPQISDKKSHINAKIGENSLADSLQENERESMFNESKSSSFTKKGNISLDEYEEYSPVATQINKNGAYNDIDQTKSDDETKEEDLKPSNSFGMDKNEEGNMRDTYKEKLVFVPKGKKLSRINIGLEYEQPKGKDDVKIDFQNSSSDANRNFNQKERKNKTCIKTFDLHCLNFSKLWYNVYELRKPSYRHVINLEIFERHYSGEMRNLWIDHTKGKMLSVGSVNENNQSQFDGSLSYKVLEGDDKHPLNPNSQKLLVPLPPAKTENDNNPEISGNPAEFLVLHNDLLSLDGSKCDKAGVGVKAFISNKDRCKTKQGRCLKNQPAALWKKDKEAKNSGGKTEYFLENFGQVTNNSFQTNKKKEHSLKFDYYGKHVSQIDVVIPGDLNVLVRKGPAQITTILVDASRENPTINVAVTNLGLASTSFLVELGECVPPMTDTNKSVDSFSSYKSKKLMVSPLHQVEFVINLCEGVPAEKMHCIVQVQNEDNRTVAARRLIIEKGARCLCVWHCQCNCIHSEINLKCRLMPYTELIASGLKGTIPVVLPLTPMDYLVVVFGKHDIDYFLLYLISLLVLLLLLGICKAVLGLTYWEEVWIAGIPYYYGPKRMKQYREKYIVNRKVEFDETGYPVHPDTKKRTVSIYNRWLEFLMNVFMFLLLPFLFLIWWPLCLCYTFLCKDSKGYQWKFSITKNASDSSSTSETSINIPENAAISNSGFSKEENLEGTPSKSRRKKNGRETRSRPIFMEPGNMEIHETSHISLVTYDGTSDEQEVRDINYVMKQMRRSSSEIQKSRERMYANDGAHRILDDEASSSHIPSSSGIITVPEAICKRRIISEKSTDTSRTPSAGEALTSLDGTYSEVTTKDSLEAVKESEAGRSSSTPALELVERLHSKKFIFRNMNKVIGQVSYPEGRTYSIRGYLFDKDGAYKFVPPTPLWQYWTTGEDGGIELINPPINLFAEEFEKYYDSAQSVVDEDDLSELPFGLCINVQFQKFDDNESFLQLSNN